MAKKDDILKIKKKSWFKIFAPKSFRNEVIGESLVESSESLMGKCISVSLAVLIGDMKKQGTVVKFKVTSVRPEGGNADIIGYEMLPASLRRFMRRGVETIANSFECMTSDNVRVRIKPMIFVRNVVKGGMSTMLNKTAKFSIIKTVKTRTYNDLLGDIITSKLQRELKEKLNKLYPVKMIEIKALVKVEGEGNGDIEEPKEDITEATEEKEEIVQEEEQEAEKEKPSEE